MFAKAKCILSLIPVAICVSVLLMALSGGDPMTAPRERPRDFFQLYMVSWNLRHDGPVYGDIGTPPELAEELGWSYEDDYSFANPPAMAPLLLPLSTLRYPVAWWALLGFSLLAGILALFLTGREIGVGTCTSTVMAGFFVCTLPFFALLALNHVESLILLLGTLGWMAFRKGKHRTGGILWGLCAGLKLFPALWIIPLFFRSNLRRGGWWAIGAGLVATGLGAWVLGATESAKFVTQVLPQASDFLGSAGNLSLLALGHSLGWNALGWLLVVLVAVGTFAGLLRSGGSLDQAWVATVTASILISPLSWSYYFILLGPCLLVLAGSLEWTRASRRLWIYTLGALLFLWPSLMGDWARDIIPDLTGWARLGFDFLPTFGALLLLLTSLIGMGNRKPNTRRVSTRG